VLVVDPGQGLGEVVRAQLEAGGFAVREAADLCPAMVSLRREHADAVVLDLTTGERDALAALGRLRADAVVGGVALIVVTGAGHRDLPLEALAAGADDYVCEPVDGHELVARVLAARRRKLLEHELRTRNAALEHLTSTDALTGVRNRRALEEEVHRLVSRSRRHGRPVAALLVDVDHFKAVNDEHGHAAGDAALRQIAARLRCVLRAEDVLGRWGGEEFLVLLPEIGALGAATTAERLRRAVAASPVGTEDTARWVTISIGWAVWDDHEPDELVAAADRELLAAKRSGRDRVFPAG